MARDKSRDDMFFSCSQDHELRYVASLYLDRNGVYDFLKRKCGDGTISYLRHMQVYQLIQRELGYPIPI